MVFLICLFVLVVFYYGGHGFHFGGDLIIPVDAMERDNSIELNDSVSPVWIKNCIQKKFPSLLFMVLDMCRTHSVPKLVFVKFNILYKI